MKGRSGCKRPLKLKNKICSCSKPATLSWKGWANIFANPYFWFLKHQETRSIDSPPPTPSPPLDKMLGYSPIFCQITQLFFSWVNKGNGGSKSILSSKENTENPINSVAVPVSNTPFPRCLFLLCQNESESSYENEFSLQVHFYANRNLFS